MWLIATGKSSSTAGPSHPLPQTEGEKLGSNSELNPGKWSWFASENKSLSPKPLQPAKVSVHKREFFSLLPLGFGTLINSYSLF